MIRYQRTKSSMFLMEILINILLFSILCVCSLQFFMKALDLTENTTTLHHAVTACSNVASIFEAGDGSLDSILETYPHAVHTDEQVIIYYNEEYQPCQRENALYYAHISHVEYRPSKIDIVFYANEDEEAIYSIRACHYTPSTAMILDEIVGEEDIIYE